MLHHFPRWPLAAALTVALTAPTLALAQQDQSGEAPASPQATQQQQQAQKLVQQYRKAAQKLQQIRQETLAANPELETQRKEFESQVQSAMDETGYDVDAGQQKLQKLGEKFQNEDLSKEERQELATKFQSERRKMQQAQQQVLQQEDIRAAGEKLQQDTLAAMKEQDPQTEALLKRMEKLRSELQGMRSGAGMGGNAGDG